ncbi:unnamed protein product [Darwinula stevensoni]|uniref:Concentrative nucleoside transporter C-terminal domain-containing protein n=1 Tax=Darwinula stevensoni TaxID=69355 RepID=A0A7R9A576_9CRUS|nr:unnamed protein product [Darwinula stevensoni]CAG0891493.1 unnamed protein product [Darwinula stevensoni]
MEAVNTLMNALCSLLGFPSVTIQYLLSYLFVPVSLAMGVSWEESRKVGELVAVKTFFDEFIAYHQLGEMKRRGLLSNRSVSIATYALCGFSNLASLGMMVAMLAALMPHRRHVTSKLAFRSFVAGSMACFLTASVAGGSALFKVLSLFFVFLFTVLTL